MTIREIEPERDAADLVALIREISPTAVINEATLAHERRSLPERAAALTCVAEVDGRVVGRVYCMRNFFSEHSRSALLGVAVREHHRRRGIGRELYQLGLSHARTLQVEGLLTNFEENDAGVGFASALGFREVRAETVSVLDPRAVRERPPSGVDLRPVASVDPHLVHAVDLEATLDVPQTETIDNIPFDEWVQHVLGNPGFTAAGSFVAMVDDLAAAVSLVIADVPSGRAHNMFTGTLRNYRGRGLGLAVKLASIGWAKANGIAMMATTNDETNAPMLAINRRLGYVARGRRVEYLRTLSE
jgi:GNAT superfamily N-acetyltransferase